MRIYQNPFQAVKETEREMREMAIDNQSYSSQDLVVEDDPNYQTKELIGYAYKIDPYWSDKDLDDILDYFQIPKDWVEAEFQERINPFKLNPGEAWKLRADIWTRFLHKGKFSYSYGERYWPQLSKIIDELTKHPTSRQIILQMYDWPKDMPKWGGKARIPCSLTYQFLVRNDELHCIYNMRSCDFITFFASDIVLTLKLLQRVAKCISIKIGTFTHFIGSLHAYRKDIDARGIF